MNEVTANPEESTEFLQWLNNPGTLKDGEYYDSGQRLFNSFYHAYCKELDNKSFNKKYYQLNPSIFLDAFNTFLREYLQFVPEDIPHTLSEWYKLFRVTNIVELLEVLGAIKPDEKDKHTKRIIRNPKGKIRAVLPKDLGL